MAITKETEIAKIEEVISRNRHRHVLQCDADISAEDAEVKAVANAVWTDTIKAAWEKHKTDNP